MPDLPGLTTTRLVILGLFCAWQQSICYLLQPVAMREDFGTTAGTYGQPQPFSVQLEIRSRLFQNTKRTPMRRGVVQTHFNSRKLPKIYARDFSSDNGPTNSTLVNSCLHNRYTSLLPANPKFTLKTFLWDYRPAKLAKSCLRNTLKPPAAPHMHVQQGLQLTATFHMSTA